MDALLKQTLSGDKITVIDNDTYELLADITIDSATTSVDISGLDIQQDQEIVLVSEIINVSVGSGSVISGYINSNYTSTNYYHQGIDANNSSVSSSRTNSNAISYCNPNSTTLELTNIKLTNNGYFVWQTNDTRLRGTSSVYISSLYGTSTFTATSITSLRIQSSLTNGIGIGSRFQLYRTSGGDKTWTTS